ncbi:MAG TPA: hypothetical protein VKY31_15300, partial [Terriglobia bacterium]|nr:hypothetical protein [Terriglobia bacterium]
MFLISQAPAIPAGTPVEARLESSIDTRTSAVGDPVVATLVRPLVSGNVRQIPPGSRLLGRVETIARGTQSS